MPSRREIESFLSEIADRESSLDLENREDFEEEVEEGEIVGRNYIYRGHFIQFYGLIDQDLGYVTIRHVFNVVDNLAKNIKESDQESVEEFTPEDGDEDYLNQARERLSRLDNSEWTDLMYGLNERLVSDNCRFYIEEGEDIPLESFVVQTKFFLNSEDVNCANLYEKLGCIFSKGLSARLWLIHCLDMKEEAFLADEDLSYEKSEPNDDLPYIG